MNEQDNCPFAANAEQIDTDQDGLGDVCDSDDDDDGLPDAMDVCPYPSAGAPDLDGDSIPDPCDDDRDGDGVSNELDNCPDNQNPKQADEDDDGVGTACNWAIPSFKIEGVKRRV